MKKTYIIIIAVLLIGLIIAGSIRRSQRVPHGEMLMGVDPKQAKLIWDDYSISYYLGATQDQIMHVLYEVEFEDGSTERRGYLDINDGEQLVYLGALTHQLPGTPLETQFIEIAKYRYIVYWVDDSIEGRLESVDFIRPFFPEKVEQDGTIKISETTNRGGIIPIYPHSSFGLWKSLSGIRIDYFLGNKKNGEFLEFPYDPPLQIDSFFKNYELDINLLYNSVRFQPGYSFWFHGGEADMQIIVDEIENTVSVSGENANSIPMADITIIYDLGITQQGKSITSEKLTVSPNQIIERGGYQIEVLDMDVGKYVQTIFLKVDPGVSK